MILDEYIRRNEEAIKANHPRTWQCEEVQAWKYWMRCFGCGLADFDEHDVKNKIGTLYGRFFIATNMTTSRPNINSREFSGWIISAWKEEIERRKEKSMVK